MKIYLLNNNTCTRVKLYGIDVKNNFLCNEHTITNKIEDADIILVNTCSFLKSKEEYFVKLIKELYNNKKTSHFSWDEKNKRRNHFTGHAQIQR